MATYNGKNADIKLGGVAVAEMGEWTLTINNDPIERGTFGSDWNKVHGTTVASWNGSFSGMLDISDSTGQLLIEAATISGTKVTNLQLYIDSTNYWTPNTGEDAAAGCYFTEYSISAPYDNVVDVSGSFTGTGPIHRTS